ncbi:MAG: lysine--tRNA ligase [Betaproteobacteria bacterium AqS2]|uniref:Lysine--tRNA ligase n=1 Tax=Candidatus Amphirhobacter heronislandensis TaxID=1732024 RepID=A0A930UAU8_9GAMM|nr:lysine--tRNA ligase [Betaproteobacteria bacterium AqS2]
MKEKGSLSIEEALAQRQRRLDGLREQGQAYPNSFVRSCTLREARARPVAEDGPELSLAGRLTNVRTAGKAAFANIADADGELQLYVQQDAAEAFAWFGELDFGDVVGVTGRLFTTRRGELTLRVERGVTLAKCLQNYTPKSAATDERQRKRRYLALAQQPELRRRFAARTRLLAATREFFGARGFLEVETPMLHAVQGGAAARPFTTEHQALGRDYFLRIAPELYLKRLLVGGYEKVFELNRSFRNEGMSDDSDFMDLTAEFIQALAAVDWLERGADFTPGKLNFKDHEIDCAAPFARIALPESLVRRHGWSAAEVEDAGFLAKQAAALPGAKAAKAQTEPELGALQCLLFEKTVEDTLIQPTFVTDFPASMSPLARRSDADPTRAERFELYVGGREIANAFSELNDPEEQARVFEEQAARAAGGDAEAMRYDEDYIAALRYGMPPAAGAGIGIDRLAMLLLDCATIRDVILFPQQRPEREGKD